MDGEDGACSEQNPICTLPSEATETGAWTSGNAAGNGVQQVAGLSISSWKRRRRCT